MRRKGEAVTTYELIELIVAATLILGGIFLYHRGGAEGKVRTGSQGAVLLLFIGAIIAIHGFGLLEYRAAGN